MIHINSYNKFLTVPAFKDAVLHKMQQQGGSFIQCLYEAFVHADSINTRKLASTFANYIDDYAPDEPEPEADHDYDLREQMEQDKHNAWKDEQDRSNPIDRR